MKNIGLILNPQTGRHTVSQELMDGIKMRQQSFEAFALNEVLTLEPTDEFEEIEGIKIPIIKVGPKNTVRLDRIFNFFMDDANIVLANVGDKNNECLELNTKPTTLKDFIASELNNELPNSITITRKVRPGAGQAYLRDANVGPIRKAALEMFNVNTLLPVFPFYTNRKNLPTDVKENWFTINHTVVTAG